MRCVHAVSVTSYLADRVGHIVSGVGSWRDELREVERQLILARAAVERARRADADAVCMQPHFATACAMERAL